MEGRATRCLVESEALQGHGEAEQGKLESTAGAGEQEDDTENRTGRKSGQGGWISRGLGEDRAGDQKSGAGKVAEMTAGPMGRGGRGCTGRS